MQYSASIAGNPSDPSTIRVWESAFSSYVMRSSGNVVALLNNVKTTSVGNVFEKVILNVNTNFSSITVINVYQRMIQ